MQTVHLVCFLKWYYFVCFPNAVSWGGNNVFHGRLSLVYLAGVVVTWSPPLLSRFETLVLRNEPLCLQSHVPTQLTSML